MKNIKNDQCEINISVIGFSGCERSKGVKGIGKSCLCNRLTQPQHYKSKHSSVVSAVEFCGSDVSNSQWWYWGSVSRELRGSRYLFRLVEQTIMVDDISHRPLVTKDDYVERATVTELRGPRGVHIVGGRQNEHAPLVDKTTVNLFLLVYDVSEVDGRDPARQVAVFRQLFDRVLNLKKPVVVVSTKHDSPSQAVLGRLSDLLARRPYSKHPWVETSASRGVNIDSILEVVVNAVTKDVKQRQMRWPYQDALQAHLAALERCRGDLRREAASVIDGELWHTPWVELRRLPAVEAWVVRLGDRVVADVVEEVRLDVRLKRRVVSQARHRDGLLRLLAASERLLPTSATEVRAIVETLTGDAEFMGHFIPFTQEAEYFDFNEHSDLLPLYLLQESNENNLIHVITEYLEQRNLEDILFNILLQDGQGNFRKPLREVAENLKESVKHFILDKVVAKVFERFQQHYLKVLEAQFLETIQQNPQLFWTHAIFKLMDTTNDQNGFSRKKSYNDLPQDNCAFPKGLIKEVNSKITFDQLPITDDDSHDRKKWISNYLSFLHSPDEHDCIYRQVTQGSCHSSTIEDVLSLTSLASRKDVVGLPHIWYVLVIGDNAMRTQLSEMMMTSENKWTLEICKVHSTTYEVQLVSNPEMLKTIIGDLGARDDRCCSLCLLICVQDGLLPASDLDRVSHAERGSSHRLSKYVVYNVVEELINFAPFEGSLAGTPQSEAQFVHISTLLYNCKKVIEPSVVWVVTMCGDPYDYGVFIECVIRVLKLHSIPKRMNGSFVTICGSFFSKEVDSRNYRLCFIPYHQAMKILIRPSSEATMDGLLLVASLDRQASINTCLGIKKYFKQELKSVSHCMLLGIGGVMAPSVDQVRTSAYKLKMDFTAAGKEDLESIPPSFGEGAESQLLDFFINIFQGTGGAASWDDMSSTASSSILQVDKSASDKINLSNHNMCKKCGQCRSSENVHNILRTPKTSRDAVSQIVPFDSVLGDVNEDVFNNSYPEYQFEEPFDAGDNLTKVKCNNHGHFDSIEGSQKVFRTRMRSQSGPDLLSLSDSNKGSLKKINTSIGHCSECGSKLSYSNEGSGSRKSCFQSSMGEKESPSKKFSLKLPDIFNPMKRYTDPQSQDPRKSFARSSSKKLK